MPLHTLVRIFASLVTWGALLTVNFPPAFILRWQAPFLLLLLSKQWEGGNATSIVRLSGIRPKSRKGIYGRFLIVVMTTLRQLRKQSLSRLGDENEECFDKAFKFIQPGVSSCLELLPYLLCWGCFSYSRSGRCRSDRRKYSGESRINCRLCSRCVPSSYTRGTKSCLDKAARAARELEELEKLTPDEIQVLQNLRERQLKIFKHEKNLEHFTSDPIDGFIPNLVKGSLGLTTRIKSESTNGSKEPEILNLLRMNGSN